MMDYINPIFYRDAYKFAHSEQLPGGITKSVSYYVPRGTRLLCWNKVMNIGLQGCIKELARDFEKNFFNVSWKDIELRYINVMSKTFKGGCASIKRVKALHDLRYLPLEIREIPEGTIVPVGIPLFSITNTHPNFAWLPQALESYISAQLWHEMICGNVAYAYRDIVEKFYKETCEDTDSRAYALSNFDFRGDESFESAVLNGVGWATCFWASATIPTALYLNKNYEVDTDETIKGALSTEHAVMCSNYFVDGNEEMFIRRMLEKYPDDNFSMVMDSFDYYRVVSKILPKLKNEIMNHNGCLLVRGDSGDPIEVVVNTVKMLWETFGGTVNSKGYKVLDKHVGVIYGDSITLDRCYNIYEKLQNSGFASNNVKLGVGSFSMQAIKDWDNEVKPFTRDTFNVAIKATYIECGGREIPIYKAPKEASFKKSFKGCCKVIQYPEWSVKDGLNYEDSKKNDCMYLLFKDGEFIDDECFTDIRLRVGQQLLKQGVKLGD